MLKLNIRTEHDRVNAALNSSEIWCKDIASEMWCNVAAASCQALGLFPQIGLYLAVVS